jgi:FRG domain
MDYLVGQGWVFRGHERAGWTLQTSLEREFETSGSRAEKELLSHFLRSAPRSLSSHLVPADHDTAAWLGLIQHHGGPTRLLDVTRSPYVALYFAFEAAGGSDRAVWGIERAWCMTECARIMAATEGISFEDAYDRTVSAQAQLVYSVVHGEPYPDSRFASFKPFSGVFPLDPWKPDSR